MLAGMEVTREELERLVAEALMRDHTFRPRRRNWNETTEQDERHARVAAAAIVTYLYRCGLRWEKLPPLPSHSTPQE